VQKVTAPGVRFELCWDHQGSGAQGGADLDLHVHKLDGPSPSPTAWFQAVAGVDNPHDCFYANCSALAFPGGADFAYANTTPDTTCHGTMGGPTWDMLGFCHNPRMDIDNINSIAVPEITGSDNVTNGDTLRAMVHYYGQDGATSTTTANEHPIVNVYCGGTLKATYGQSPDPIPDGFNFGMGLNVNGGGAGMLWRVADVHATGLDVGGNATCTVTPLHPPLTSSGYWVITDRNNVDFSY
jgi:hypothetical protein